MDEENYYTNQDIEINMDNDRCPNCDIRMPNDICPQCGIPKEKAETDEDDIYDRRERR